MSQQKIGVFYSGNGPFENYVAEIDLESCEHEVLFAFSHSLGFSDLLYAPDGYFYGTSGEGSFLVRMDANDGSYINSWAIPHPVFTTNVYAAIAMKEDGVIIIGGRHGSLAEFDIYTDEITWLGYLEDQNPNGIVISGLTYFNERLFAISARGVVAEIFKEELTLNVLLQTPGSDPQSLTYLEDQCGEPVLISGLANGGLRYIYPDRDSFYNSCSVETSNRAIFGITSYTEYQGFPACRDIIDLNGLTAGFDQFGEDVCGLGRTHIAHDSVAVYGEFAMDSIGVAVVEDPDMGAGTIEVGNVGGIAVVGAGTGEVLAYGAVDFSDWEVWLRKVEYVSTSPDPTAGIRRIAVVGYFNGGETTDTAWAEIEVFRPEFSAGVGAEIEECPTGEQVDLFDYLSEADEGGRWEPALSDGMLDLIPSNSGIYSYIVDHPECGSDTALVDLFVWPGPDIVIEGGGEWCTGDAAELGVMGDLSKVVSYLWNTGEMVSRIEVNESGTYWVRLGYGEDCIWTDTL